MRLPKPQVPLGLCRALLFACGPALLSQCPAPGSWTSLGPLASPDGSVEAMCEWDPDGAGPMPRQVVCGGLFSHAGAVAAANVARYDPSSRTWAPLGAGFDGEVRALAVLPGNVLVAGGRFQLSGGVAVASVAQWNGFSWAPLGGGTDGNVTALCTLPSGELVAGGSFASAGGAPCANVARWNGAAWQALAGGLAGSPAVACAPPDPVGVQHLEVRSNGELIAAGVFAAGNGLARWDGSAWNGIAVPSGFVTALTVLAGDDLLVGVTDCGQSSAMRWDGSVWTALGAAGTTGWATFAETSTGALYGGRRDPWSVFGDLWRYDGTEWRQIRYPLLLQNLPTRILELAPGDLVIAQRMLVGASPTVSRFDGGAASPASAGLDALPAVLETRADRLLLAGPIRQVANTPVREIAVLENGVCDDLGGGIDGQVMDAAFLPDGDIVAAGFFQLPNGMPDVPIWRWDGQQWQPVGDPRQVAPFAVGMELVDVLADGTLVGIVAWPHQVVRWDAPDWGSLGLLPTDLDPEGLLEVGATGNLVVFGVGGNVNPTEVVWRWDGNVWSPLPGLVESSRFGAVCGAVLPDGDIVVGGAFHFGGRVLPLMRWNGSVWSAIAGFPSDRVFDLAVLPGGDLLVAHGAVDLLGNTIRPLSRWDGARWTPVPGIEATGDGSVYRVVLDDAERLVATGTFVRVQGAITGRLARYESGCAAAATAVGAGCSGPLGPVETNVLELPWLGDQFVARTVGVPANAVAVSVLGLQAAQLALSSVLPQAGAGCTLHTSPDALSLLLPVAGAVETRLAVPVHPALIGGAFRHQVVAIELGAAGITNVTSSGAYELTIGSW